MNSNFDYKKLYTIATHIWYYLLAILLAFILAAHVYISFATPLYQANAAIRIDDKKTQLTELITVKNVYDRSSKSETEKFILSSRSVLHKAVISMDQQVDFYREDKYHRKNTYPFKPLTIKFFQYPALQPQDVLFTYEPVSATKFKLSFKNSNHQDGAVFSYEKIIRSGGFTFKISTPKNAHPLTDKYYFQFNPLSERISSVKNSLKIDDNLNTNILTLRFTDANPEYAKDMLNAVLKEYQEYDRDQQALSMSQISIYIDTLLQRMAIILRKSGLEMQNFKTGNQLISLSSNAEALRNQLTQLETQKHELDLKTLLNRHLKKAIDKNTELTTLNFNTAGFYDAQLNTLLSRYNLLLDKKSEAQPNFPVESAYMLRLDGQISTLKNEVANHLLNQDHKDQELIKYLGEQISMAKQSIASVPKTERSYVMLQSEFNVNQKVYDYLSEKKLEAEIARASITPNAQLIDRAAITATPVYPIKREIYQDFTLAGVFFTGLLLFLAHKFDQRLYSISLVEETTSIPIIGILQEQPNDRDPGIILALDKPRSLFSESLRAMRANLQQQITADRSTVICISSAVAGEGKSFTSLNLAGTLSLMNRKVVIVATDLRKSVLHETFGVDNVLGLSNYLSGNVQLSDICYESQFQNLDFIPAGPSATNPAELLQSDRISALIHSLRERYDFIILDTAPVGLVADSIPLMSMADLNLFVLRYGISSVASIRLPGKLKKEFHLNHMALVLNSFEHGNTPKEYYSLSTSSQAYQNYDAIEKN